MAENMERERKELEDLCIELIEKNDIMIKHALG